MTNKDIAGGIVHKVPQDFQTAILATKAAHTAWQDITPIARNEWICWVTSAKKTETRAHRIERMCEDLSNGKRRPCCWPGCPHR